MLFQHQQSAYNELLKTARAFFDGDWQDLPVRPRFNRFVTGPTGLGKTTIVGEVAREIGVPMFQLSASNWIPLGASERGARLTWLDIADFCLQNEKGIIFLDETDKIGVESPWASFVRVEIFALLDHSIPLNLSLSTLQNDEDPVPTEELRGTICNRLRNRMLIIGAGAFQSKWAERNQKSCGFHAGTTASMAPEFAITEMHDVIPAELANRFSSQILQLRPLNAEDYRRMAEHAAKTLSAKHSARFLELAAQHVDAAVTNQSGCRWVEELLRTLVEEATQTKAEETAREMLRKNDAVDIVP